MCSASSGGRAGGEGSAGRVPSRAAGAAPAPRATHAQQLGGELAQPRTGGARARQHGHLGAEALAPARELLARAGLVHQVDLREHEHARQQRQALVVQGELALDRGVVGERVRALSLESSGAMSSTCTSRLRALDVREEVVAEAGAGARALDQPGDVGDHELALVGFEHPENRRERRERVVGDLRRGAREAREQRGLAGVGQADEADVGEQPQAELEPAFLARQPALGEAGGLARGGGEALVALAAAAPARDMPLARARAAPRAALERAAVLGLAADWVPGGTRDPQLLAVGPVAQRALAVAAAPGAVVGAPPEGLQVAQRGRRRPRRTSPPRPPSPPSGPPRGTCASRRKLTQPSPPAPAWTWILARSWSIWRAS